MRGAWLASFARRLLHDDTFDLVVSPAIADLQFEERGYGAVWIALGGAYVQDLGGDLRELCDDAAMLGCLIGIQASYFFGMLVLVGGGLPAKQAPAIVATLLALCVTGTVVLFWPQKRRAT